MVLLLSHLCPFFCSCCAELLKKMQASTSNLGISVNVMMSYNITTTEQNSKWNGAQVFSFNVAGQMYALLQEGHRTQATHLRPST